MTCIVDAVQSGVDAVQSGKNSMLAEFTRYMISYLLSNTSRHHQEFSGVLSFPINFACLLYLIVYKIDIQLYAYSEPFFFLHFSFI
jgi:hypothetical protein